MTPKVVQGAPDVGIKIKMRKLAPEPAAPAPCPPARVLDPTGEVVAELGCGEEYQYECPPGGGVCAIDEVMWVTSPFTDGLTVDHDGWEAGIYDPRKLVMTVLTNATLLAVARGQTSGLEWVWEWSEPPPAPDGVELATVEQAGGIASVSVLSHGGIDATITLMLTALCAGEPAGALTLKVVWLAW